MYLVCIASFHVQMGFYAIRGMEGLGMENSPLARYNIKLQVSSASPAASILRSTNMITIGRSICWATNMITIGRSICWATALLAALTSAQVLDGPFSSSPREALAPEHAAIVPGRFIIELEHPSRRRQNTNVESVVEDINARGHNATLEDDLSGISSLFDGATVEITGDNEGSELIDEIKVIPGVANVWPVHTVTLNTTFDITADTTGTGWNHLASRVNDLHARGLDGVGQRVCVIDSGVDIDHPVLAGRIAGGKNMIDNTDVIEDCSGHGTFVFSVIVANDKNFKGVAPAAEIFMYKIFGCGTGTGTDLVVKALLAAEADGCEIINLSLGSNTGYRDTITARIAAEIAKERLLVIAAGNAGSEGSFFASSPAVAPGVLSVGSVDAAHTIAWPALIRSSSGDSLNISYVTYNGLNSIAEDVDVPLDFETADSCNIALRTTVRETAVISKRGVCASRQSSRRMGDAGYGYAIMFDSYDQGVYYMPDIFDAGELNGLKLFGVTAASVGDWIEEQVAANSTFRLVISANAAPLGIEGDVPSSGQVSDFSSWGPSYENHASPLVVAPGGDVLDAYPGSRLAFASGTSFSSPYVAGIAALYFAHVKKNKDGFIRRIASTCKALPGFNALLASTVASVGPVAQQGAGMINAVAVFDHQVVLLSEPILHLNDTDNRISAHTICVSNPSDKAIIFAVSHVASVSIRSTTPLGTPWPYFPPMLEEEGSFSGPETLTVAAGSIGEITVTLSPPSVAADTRALWGGKVYLEGSNGEVISVAYLGVEASAYEWGALPMVPEVLRYDSASGYHYHVDHLGVPYKPSEGDSPEIWFAFRYGTYEFSVDIVGEDWTTDMFEYPPRASVGSDAWYGHIRQVAQGINMDMPMRDIVRFTHGRFVNFRSLANGTDIPSGRYKVLTRALRIFGQASNPADWQLFLSDSFPIQLGDDPVPGQTTNTSAAVTQTATVISHSTVLSPSTVLSISTEAAPSSVTSSDIPSTTSISVPGGTTTLTVAAAATPTGLEGAITNLQLSKWQDPSPIINDADEWMEIRIQVSIPGPASRGDTVIFSIPEEFVDIPPTVALRTSSSGAGTTTFDTGTRLFTMALSEWTTWNKNLRGDFYIRCRFAPDFISKMKRGTYVVHFPVVGGIISSVIYLGPIDRTDVFTRIRTLPYDDTTLFVTEIEVPASLGPFESFSIDTWPYGDDGYICDEAGVYIGTAACHDQGLRNVTEVQGLTSCNIKKLTATYTGPVQDGDAVRFRVPAVQGNRRAAEFGVIFNLNLHLANGTTILSPVAIVEYLKITRARPHLFNFFEGERVVPV